MTDEKKIEKLKQAATELLLHQELCKQANDNQELARIGNQVAIEIYRKKVEQILLAK